MTVEKLKRVVWRLREIKKPDNIYTYNEVRRAIMEEIGMDERTIIRNITHMLEFKIIQKEEFGKFKLIYEEDIESSHASYTSA